MAGWNRIITMAVPLRTYSWGKGSGTSPKAVRRSLSSYGIRPQLRPWRLTWEWANAIRLSYYDPRWPIPSEIAAQYVLLLLGEMSECRALKLPYRATTHAPTGDPGRHQAA
jgi:hypothetical protein